VLVVVEPAFPRLPVRQDTPDQAPKLRLVIAVLRVAYLVDGSISANERLTKSDREAFRLKMNRYKHAPETIDQCSDETR
jgi:hypothetical protein